MVCKFILLHGAFILIFFFFFLFVCIPLLSVSPAFPLQLCNGGSVTELVKGLLMFGQRLDEAVISYILYGALLVRKVQCSGDDSRRGNLSWVGSPFHINKEERPHNIKGV